MTCVVRSAVQAHFDKKSTEIQGRMANIERSLNVSERVRNAALNICGPFSLCFVTGVRVYICPCSQVTSRTIENLKHVTVSKCGIDVTWIFLGI